MSMCVGPGAASLGGVSLVQARIGQHHIWGGSSIARHHDVTLGWATEQVQLLLLQGAQEVSLQEDIRSRSNNWHVPSLQVTSQLRGSSR